MTNHDQKIDANIDSILKAAGSSLRHYTMQKTLDDLRNAMRKIMSDSYIAGSNDHYKVMRNIETLMEKGRVDTAVRWALNKFDEWNELTGFVQQHTGCYYEIQGIIEDAVHCGIQGALNLKEPLPSEKE